MATRITDLVGGILNRSTTCADHCLLLLSTCKSAKNEGSKVTVLTMQPRVVFKSFEIISILDSYIACTCLTKTSSEETKYSAR